jgi:hypothetical protein
MLCVCDMFWHIAGCRNYDCSKMWWNFETAVYYEVYTRADQCSCQAVNSLISHWPSVILSDVCNENRLIDSMPMMKRIIQNKILVPPCVVCVTDNKEETYFRGDTLIISTGK